MQPDGEPSSEPPLQRPAPQPERVGRAALRGGEPGRLPHPAPDLDLADPRALLGRDAVERLRAQIIAALTELGVGGDIRVRLLDDREMSAAHARYRGDAATTDVLTFDLRPDGAPPGTLDADILVCVDEAARQAASRGLPVERELLLYILHGVLHCLGYDDHSDESAAAMHRREDQVLRAIGVGTTYALPGAAPAGSGIDGSVPPMGGGGAGTEERPWT